jgi:hypothetical protein
MMLEFSLLQMPLSNYQQNRVRGMQFGTIHNSSRPSYMLVDGPCYIAMLTLM